MSRLGLQTSTTILCTLPISIASCCRRLSLAQISGWVGFCIRQTGSCILSQPSRITVLSGSVNSNILFDCIMLPLYPIDNQGLIKHLAKTSIFPFLTNLLSCFVAKVMEKNEGVVERKREKKTEEF